jgi:hypothetical protein
VVIKDRRGGGGIRERNERGDELVELSRRWGGEERGLEIVGK